MESIHRNRGTGQGEAIRQIRKNTYLVQSFTEPDTYYETNPVAKTCNCGAGGFGRCVKHICLSAAVANVPVGIGSGIAIARITELCHKTFSKKLSRLERYEILTDTLYSPHASTAMKIAAQKLFARAS